MRRVPKLRAQMPKPVRMHLRVKTVLMAALFLGALPAAPALAAAGKVSSSAWYELVPSPSHGLSLRVRPGDSMIASVTVTGHQVVLSLNDATRHQTAVKRLRAATVDTSSAEWILEAPSECEGLNSCQTLPLADFCRASFALTAARTTGGHVGWISDPSWTATQIRLTPAAAPGLALPPTGAPAPPSESRRRPR